MNTHKCVQGSEGMDGPCTHLLPSPFNPLTTVPRASPMIPNLPPPTPRHLSLGASVPSLSLLSLPKLYQGRASTASTSCKCLYHLEGLSSYVKPSSVSGLPHLRNLKASIPCTPSGHPVKAGRVQKPSFSSRERGQERRKCLGSNRQGGQAEAGSTE